MYLWVNRKKKNEEKKYFLKSLKSLKKGVGSGVGSESGSITQRYGSGDPDSNRDSHQNVTNHQHWFLLVYKFVGSFFYLLNQTNVKIDFYFPVQVMLRTDSAAGVVVEAGGAGAPEAAAVPTVAAAAAPNP